MSEIEVEQINERRTMGVGGKGGGEGEGERQHDDVIAVDTEGALPELVAHGRFFLRCLANVEPCDEEGGEEDEAFGRGDEAEGLIDEIAEMRGKVRQGHPDEEEPAEGIELRLPLQPAEPEDGHGCLLDTDRHGVSR